MVTWGLDRYPQSSQLASRIPEGFPMSPLRRTAAVIAVFLLAAPLVSALAAQTTAQDTLDRLSATAPAPLAVTQASLPTTANLELQAPKARIIAAGVTQRVSGTSNVPTLFAARAT